MRQRVLPLRVQFFSMVFVLTAAFIACAKSPDDKPSSGDPATTGLRREQTALPAQVALRAPAVLRAPATTRASS